ncbi:hypothetical protein C8J56DRAFT_937796 [Mycena floridula]|nr:hypothetical protein C8J56DRAFT_937796 [Mycena floridula]
MSPEPSKWSHIPGDLLIIVAENCTLSDSLIIPQVCRAFWQIFQNRITWITILKAYRSRKCGPLDCPMHDDFSTRSLENLKGLAIRALRVQKSLRSHPLKEGETNSPQILTLTMDLPSTPFQFPQDQYLIALIPGTDFGLFMSATTACCWDIVEGKSITSVKFGEIGDEFFLFSQAGIVVCEASERWLIAIETNHPERVDTRCLVILAVDHSATFDSPVISVAMRRDDIARPHPLTFTFVLTMFAVVCKVDSFLSILAINPVSGREHTISTNIVALPADTVLVEFMEDDGLQLFVNTLENHTVYYLPRKFFPYDDNLTPSMEFTNPESRHLIPRSTEIQQSISQGNISDSVLIYRSPAHIIMELVESADDGPSPVFLLLSRYISGTESMEYYSQIKLPAFLLHDDSTFMYHSPAWNVFVLELSDTRREEGERNSYFLLQYEGQTVSLLQLQFPVGLDLLDIFVNAERGELIVVTEEGKLVHLSYLQ